MEGLSLEILQCIQETAQKAAGAEDKAKIISIPGAPPHEVAFVNPSGEIIQFVVTPHPRSHMLVALSEAIQYANDKGDKDKTVIWFGRDAVVILLDDETRRDRATLKLTLTPQMRRLISIEGDRTTFEQRDFRRLLRIDLAGCTRDDVLLRWVSDMQWSNQGLVTGKITHGRESLGKDIDNAAASNLDECPESIVLDVRVFDTPDLTERRAVKCAVEILPTEQRFRLTPLPLALHDAIENEVQSIGDEIRDAVECNVFRGCP